MSFQPDDEHFHNILKMSSAAAAPKTAWLPPLLKVTILTLVFVVAFASRLFAVIRFESIIHEFDPWFAMAEVGDIETEYHESQVQLPSH